MPLARIALLGLAAAALSLPEAARAGEDDRAFSVSLSYATFDGEDRNPDGVVLGADYERGLSDSVSFRASAGAGLYCDACTAWSAHASAGLTYAFDVLKYVPYASVGLGGLVVGGGEVETEVRPIVELGAGLDILQSRELSWGPVLRFETYPGEQAFLTVGLRVTWRWGYF